MLYRSYYNRQYYKRIEQMHEKYGPVIRTSPNEIHLIDPDNYDRIYSNSSRYEKPAAVYDSYLSPAAAFATPSNEVHRVRRAALNPIFSRRMVLGLEDVVQSKAWKIAELTTQALQENRPMDFYHAFRSLSTDVISDFAFDKSFNLLDSPDLGAAYLALIRQLNVGPWVLQQLPFLIPLVTRVLPWLAPLLSKSLGSVYKIKQQCADQIEDVRAHLATQKGFHDRPTIFSQLIDPPNTTEDRVCSTDDELRDEALSVLAAASDTTGNAMTVAAYHVIGNRQVYDKLTAELRQAFPDAEAKLDFLKLEKLPYLTGVVKESLSFGVIGRLARVVPEPGATFNGHHVPAGSVVGMSAWLMHRNEAIFPDAMKFSPERWLDPKNARKMEHHMVPFGRGSRQCVGMPLAYCEIYVTIGTLFHRFDNLEVFETTDEDMEYDDFFASMNKPSKHWFKAVGAA
ncbi:hypothetical protein B0A49_03639 [Cryomyces minteri]|uniref:Trichodiene oxygenase n=1 Tax=Cryomyces minteri TaxID=331657 RepID=A0A4U0XJ06_9PEZI|nr:hypothetical protein B0A49_03639 [Cryomyces minteri]